MSLRYEREEIDDDDDDDDEYVEKWLVLMIEDVDIISSLPFEYQYSMIDGCSDNITSTTATATTTACHELQKSSHFEIVHQIELMKSEASIEDDSKILKKNGNNLRSQFIASKTALKKNKSIDSDEEEDDDDDDDDDDDEIVSQNGNKNANLEIIQDLDENDPDSLKYSLLLATNKIKKMKVKSRWYERNDSVFLTPPPPPLSSSTGGLKSIKTDKKNMISSLSSKATNLPNSIRKIDSTILSRKRLFGESNKLLSSFYEDDSDDDENLLQKEKDKAKEKEDPQTPSWGDLLSPNKLFASVKKIMTENKQNRLNIVKEYENNEPETNLTKPLRSSFF